MKRKLFLLLSIIIFLLGGCTLAPKYTTTGSPVPANWPTGAAYSETKTDDICAGSIGVAMAGIYHR